MRSNGEATMFPRNCECGIRTTVAQIAPDMWVELPCARHHCRNHPGGNRYKILVPSGFMEFEAVKAPNGPVWREVRTEVPSVDREIEKENAAFRRVLKARPGDVIAGHELERKGIENGIHGWWVSTDAGDGFVSLANLVALEQGKPLRKCAGPAPCSCARCQAGNGAFADLPIRPQPEVNQGAELGAYKGLRGGSRGDYEDRCNTDMAPKVPR